VQAEHAQIWHYFASFTVIAGARGSAGRQAGAGQISVLEKEVMAAACRGRWYMSNK
jgi:hypothetical protein